ncbi:hypothetical protein DRO33_06045, partial [Candidatus Bathyarchaeota archaeon]
MKVAVYYGPNDIRLEERPRPEVGPRDILVEMRACGICGSDLMDWYLAPRAPLVLGHEPTGVVVEVGREVEGFSEGDRVFAHHHVSCMTCRFCRRGQFTLCPRFRQTHLDPGGFSEFFRVPEPNLALDTFKLPNRLSYEEGTLIEPLACCLRAVRKARVGLGDRVAVVGAGPSGLMIAFLSKLAGATLVAVSDLVPYRLRAARAFGADLVVDAGREELSEAVKAETDGLGADVVFVTAPSLAALEAGARALRRGGTLLIFAPTAPEVGWVVRPNSIFFDEITITASYSTTHIETRDALSILVAHRKVLGRLITHRFGLEQIAEAFRLAKESKE